jgi:hypothetical protein
MEQNAVQVVETDLDEPIVLAEDQAAIIFSPTNCELHLPALKKDRPLKPHEMLAAMMCWLVTKPEKVGQLLEEMHSAMDESHNSASQS